MYICLIGCGKSPVSQVSSTAKLSSDNGMSALIAEMSGSNSRERRLAAIKTMQTLPSRQADAGIDALSRIATDPDVEMRKAALFSAATIAYRNHRECPLALVTALFDDAPEVRSCAVANMGFDTFPEAAFDVLLRATDHPDWQVRLSATSDIAKAVHDKSQSDIAVARLTTALADSDFLIRNNAASSIWILTQNPDLVLPHYLRYVDGELDPHLEPELKRLTQDRYARELEKIAVHFPKNVARALHAGLESQIYQLRRNTINQIPELASANSELRTECERSNIPTLLKKLRRASDHQIVQDANTTLVKMKWNTNSEAAASGAP